MIKLKLHMNITVIVQVLPCHPLQEYSTKPLDCYLHFLPRKHIDKSTFHPQNSKYKLEAYRLYYLVNICMVIKQIMFYS